MSYLYNVFVFNPLYNSLIYLMDVFPWVDAGMAVIILTIVVRLILFPLSKKSIVTQVRMKEIEPELNKIKNTVTDKQQQTLKIMALYKERGVNPFSSFFMLFIQIPIIFALYSIFIRSGLPVVKTTLLYSFVSVPTISMHFLGIIDVGSPNIYLAIIASIAQYVQLHFSVASAGSNQKSSSPQADMTQNMMKSMKYVLPVMVFMFTYKIAAVVALYWTVGSLFTLAQELVVRRHISKHQPL